MKRMIRTDRAGQNWLVVFQNDTLTLSPPLKYGNVFLWQLGDLCGEPGFSIDEHEQFCHELVLMCQGEAVMTLDGQKYKVREAQILMIRYGTRHKIDYVGAGPVRMMYLGFMFDENIDPRYVEFVNRAPYQLAEDVMGMRALFDLSMSEYENQTELHEEALDAILRLLIICAYRSFDAGEAKPYQPLTAFQDVDNQLVRRLAEYIGENALSIASLQEVAETFRYSYSYLSHTFSQHTGVTLREYFERCRFDHAFQMLKDPDLTITQIANRLNYQSIHTFSRAFNKQYGITPSRCQRMLRDVEFND